jgi:drug/metabolite transporter (DMT)-like permease
MNSDGDRVALVCFVSTSLVMGSSALGIRFSNRELAPLWGASMRFMFAVALLLAIMAVMRLRFPRGRALHGALIYGVLNFGLSYGLSYWGFVKVHAGLGQILFAVVPLATLLFAVAQRQERFRPAALGGAVVAIAGVVLLSSAPLQDGVPLLSLAALLAAALCVAQGTVLVRRFPTVHPVVMNAVGMGVGAIMVLVASLLTGEHIALPHRTTTWVAVIYLAAVGSVLAFVLLLMVLNRWSASRTSYAFVIMPLVTLSLSAWLDNEPLRDELLLGGLLVFAGVYFGALRGAPSKVPAPAPSPP